MNGLAFKLKKIIKIPKTKFQIFVWVLYGKNDEVFLELVDTHSPSRKYPMQWRQNRYFISPEFVYSFENSEIEIVNNFIKTLEL